MQPDFGSHRCFYCSNPVNKRSQPHVVAAIRHEYKRGCLRVSTRAFHPVCIEKFEEEGGRPYNPHTRYVILTQEHVNWARDETCSLHNL